MGLVWEWWELHRAELMDCWDRAQAAENPGKIAPLE